MIDLHILNCGELPEIQNFMASSGFLFTNETDGCKVIHGNLVNTNNKGYFTVYHPNLPGKIKIYFEFKEPFTL